MQWQLRITPLTSQGEILKTPEVETDVAGPCCIAGDVIASRRMVHSDHALCQTTIPSHIFVLSLPHPTRFFHPQLPELSPGDFVAVHDTGESRELCFLAPSSVFKGILMPSYLIRNSPFLAPGAYFHSSWSYYNSRQSPNLFFWDSKTDQHTLVKAGDSVEKTLEFFTP